MINSNEKSIFVRCEALLGEILKEIKKSPDTVNYAEMVNILVVHSQSEGINLLI